MRDSNYDEVDIKEGNIIGMVEGQIDTVGDDISQIIDSIMISMVDEDSSLITIYYGEEIELESANLVKEQLQGKYTDCDVEMHYGGQPLYYYIISVE